jgi:hypothetical protein
MCRSREPLGLTSFCDVLADFSIVNVESEIANDDAVENLVGYIKEYQLARLSLTDEYQILAYNRHIFGPALATFYQLIAKGLSALERISKRIVSESRYDERVSAFPNFSLFAKHFV